MKNKSTIDELLPKMNRLRLMGMLPKLQEMMADPDSLHLSHLQWLSDLFDVEIARRDGNAMNRRIKEASVKYKDACISLIDFKVPRGLQKLKIQDLAECDWIRNHQNCIITGATGCGKSYIASALTNAACLQRFDARFVRVPRFLKRLNSTHVIDREFEKTLKELRNIDLLVLDDWGIGQMDATARSDLLEIIEDRCGNASTMITSVLPVSSWAQYINDATYADSIMDRVVRNAHRIQIKGESMRQSPKYGAITERVDTPTTSLQPRK